MGRYRSVTKLLKWQFIYVRGLVQRCNRIATEVLFGYYRVVTREAQGLQKGVTGVSKLS